MCLIYLSFIVILADVEWRRRQQVVHIQVLTRQDGRRSIAQPPFKTTHSQTKPDSQMDINKFGASKLE